MALLDIFTGQQGSSDRVPPIARALAGLLSYSKLKPGKDGAAPTEGADYAERLEDFFKPSASGGPTAKGGLTRHALDASLKYPRFTAC